MTKKDLINQLAPFGDDAKIIIMDGECESNTPEIRDFNNMGGECRIEANLGNLDLRKENDDYQASIEETDHQIKEAVKLVEQLKTLITNGDDSEPKRTNDILELITEIQDKLEESH